MSIDDLLNPGYSSASQLNHGHSRRLRSSSTTRPPREAREERTPLVTPPSGVPFSRRKIPISNPVSYLMEAMSTDLKACGESFVPDKMAGQTLVLLGRSVPIRIDEALDHEMMAFMEAPSKEAYTRGVGLPGLAWARARPEMVKLSELDRDGFFTSGGPRWVVYNAGCELPVSRGTQAETIGAIPGVVVAVAEGTIKLLDREAFRFVADRKS